MHLRDIDNRDLVNYHYAYLEYLVEYDLQLAFLLLLSRYLKNNSVNQVAINHTFFSVYSIFSVLSAN